MNYINVIIEPSDAGARLDKTLARHLTGFSRSRLQQLIAEGAVTMGAGTITDANRKVKPGDIYQVAEPLPVPLDLVASGVQLTVIYEDKHFLIIDKPAGMTVHPAPGHADDTLVNALLSHCGGSLSGIGGVMRPGIVHRIDKDTSGLLVVAKHDAAHKNLAAQLATRTLSREYIAVVRGVPNPLEGRIEGNIGRSSGNRKKMAVMKTGGKPALTYYKTEELFKGAAQVRCKLDTGRTHQIRVHLTHIGHPLIGDPVYGGRGKGVVFGRQALHAAHLALLHPLTQEKMEFFAPMPPDMAELMERLRGA